MFSWHTLFLYNTQENTSVIDKVKTKYIVMSHQQTAGKGRYKFFENMTKFKYLGIMATNRNCIHK
jgi:hypothetical protein